MESLSFSTGQIFGYWTSWEEDTAMPNDSKKDIFNGYSKSELFITPI